MNFILIKYKKKIEINTKNKVFTTKDFSTYLNSQDIFFEIMQKQILHYYPNAHIHVLTNDSKNCKEKSNTTFHFKNFQSNHTCKFLLYGLLNEPALYLDCDIVLLSEFTNEHLNTDNSFNLFSISRHFNLQTISYKLLPVATNILFNAGIIYIKKPDVAIVNDLLELNEKFFSDQQYIESKNEWPNNDEYALSLYIKIKNIKMQLHNDVNVLRFSIDSKELTNKKIQSLHYTGIKAKNQIKQEFDKFPVFHSIVKESGHCLTKEITLL